jgi:hypothetical protein
VFSYSRQEDPYGLIQTPLQHVERVAQIVKELDGDRTQAYGYASNCK